MTEIKMFADVNGTPHKTPEDARESDKRIAGAKLQAAMVIVVKKFQRVEGDNSVKSAVGLVASDIVEAREDIETAFAVYDAAIKAAEA